MYTWADNAIYFFCCHDGLRFCFTDASKVNKDTYCSLNAGDVVSLFSEKEEGYVRKNYNCIVEINI